MAGPRDDPEDQGASEFHETEYYSKFQEQDGTLPNREEIGAPGGAPEPAPERREEEVDERAIQELMDAALRKGAGMVRDEPENLDTSIRSDWRAPRVAPPRAAEAPPRALRGTRPTPRPSIRRAADLVADGKRGKRRRGSRLFSRRRIGFFLKALALLLGTLALGGGIYYYERLQREGISALLAHAAEAHEGGAYQAAEEYYSMARKVPGGISAQERARLAFLQGGVNEQLYRSSGEPERRQAAMRYYDEAVESDESEHRGYAVEALLAKADLLAATVEGVSVPDPERLKLAEKELQTLIESPEYTHHPALTLGLPHRRLAALIEAEDPRRAIELLLAARDNQKYLEEGIENLAIARIHEDRLMDTVQAREFYELVRQNELASAESRTVAETALAEIRGLSGEGLDLFQSGLLEEQHGEGNEQ